MELTYRDSVEEGGWLLVVTQEQLKPFPHPSFQWHKALGAPPLHPYSFLLLQYYVGLHGWNLLMSIFNCWLFCLLSLSNFFIVSMFLFWGLPWCRLVRKPRSSKHVDTTGVMRRGPSRLRPSPIYVRHFSLTGHSMACRELGGLRLSWSPTTWSYHGQ